MLTQLSPPWPVFVEGRGAGYAMAVIDYSQEHHLLFVVAMDATGEIWAVPNPDVRLQWNPSMGRVAGRACPAKTPAVAQQPATQVVPTGPAARAQPMTGKKIDAWCRDMAAQERADHHPADGVVLEIRVRPNGPEGYSEWESRCVQHPEYDGFRDEVLSHLLRRMADVKPSGFPSHAGPEKHAKETGCG